MPTLLPPLRTLHATERRGALAWLAALGAACVLAPPMRAETVFGLVQLMQTLAQVKAGEARFVERRSVTMLERTLESSGRLSFEAPDTFVRETLKPRRERLAIVGNNLTMSLGQRSRTVPLDSVPEASLIMEAIRGTLTGNRAALERHFSATVSGDPQRWLLELVPREPRLRELVISVRVAGRQAVLREITVAMADGDRSVMSIEPLLAGSQMLKPAEVGAPPVEPATAVARPASAAS